MCSARLGKAPTPAFLVRFQTPFSGWCLYSAPRTRWGELQSRGSALRLTRWASPPLHYRVVGSPDRLGTFYVCGSPQSSLKYWGICCSDYLQRTSSLPKGLRPSGLPALAAVRLGCWVNGRKLPFFPTPELKAVHYDLSQGPVSSLLRRCGPLQTLDLALR